MSPRAYNLGKRQAASDDTRARIIAAARELLVDPEGVSAFTLEAVARKAGVARMTVYYQYASKAGLLEALYDDLAARSLVPLMPAVFRETDPRRALFAVVDAFTGFWGAERLVTRRLRALALIDPVIEAGIRERDQWRHGHFDRMLTALLGPDAQLKPAARGDLLDSILLVTSFESYDFLAADRDSKRTQKLVRRLVQIQLQSAGLEV